MLARILVTAIVLSTATAAAEDLGSSDTTTSVAKPTAVGYMRGLGLDNYGLSIARMVTPRFTPTLHLFALYETGQTGFAIAPSIQIPTSLVARERSAPYAELGVQYVRAWFGDASGGGFGWFVAFGYEFRMKMGLAVQLGAGFHVQQKITATDGMVELVQPGNFGLHWNLGVRYWF